MRRPLTATQAERLKPEGWKENRLFLAKCYVGLGEYGAAVGWLDRADAIPMAMPDVREGVKVSGWGEGTRSPPPMSDMREGLNRAAWVEGTAARAC